MSKDTISSVFERDLETFMRRGLSGYVYILLVGPLVVLFFRDFASCDIGIVVVAFLALAGPAVGAIIYQVYHLAFWKLAWGSKCFMACWKLDHVKTLKEMGKQPKVHDRYLRALWDTVFFTSKKGNTWMEDVRQRILNQWTRAHSSATVGTAILLAILTWSWALCMGYYAPFGIWNAVGLVILTVGVLVLLLDHRRLCQDASSLENLFLHKRKDEVTKILAKDSEAWKDR